MDEAKQIIYIFFLNKHMLREMLKQIQLESDGLTFALVLSVDTRRGSNAKILKLLLKN